MYYGDNVGGGFEGLKNLADGGHEKFNSYRERLYKCQLCFFEYCAKRFATRPLELSSLSTNLTLEV